MKVVLLNGGGMDTLAAIHKLPAMYPGTGIELNSLLVNFNYPNIARLRAAAEAIAAVHCVTHHEFVMPEQMWRVNPAAPCGIGVPYQTPVLHLLAANYAVRIGCSYVISGMDSVVGKGFFAKFEAMLGELVLAKIAYKISVIAPVHGLSKQDRLALVAADPLIDVTVSCHHEPACGECKKCIERVSLGLKVN